MTPYEVLGIEPGADEKTVKAAFKRLAKKHHPDVGGDEAKFKEINAAYTALTEKGNEGFAGGFDAGNAFDDLAAFGLGGIFNEHIFNTMFRSGGHGRQQIQVPIDPELMLKGGSFEFTYQTIERNNNNQGASGRIGGRIVNKKVTIMVEPDTAVGTMIAVPGTAPHLSVQIVPGHTRRYRVSDMIHLTEQQDINIFKAMVGGSHEITTPLGKKISINIPAGTQIGEIHRVHGHGLKVPDGSRGDYNVQFIVKIPAITGTEDEIAQQILAEIKK